MCVLIVMMLINTNKSNFYAVPKSKKSLGAAASVKQMCFTF